MTGWFDMVEYESVSDWYWTLLCMTVFKKRVKNLLNLFAWVLEISWLFVTVFRKPRNIIWRLDIIILIFLWREWVYFCVWMHEFRKLNCVIVWKRSHVVTSMVHLRLDRKHQTLAIIGYVTISSSKALTTVNTAWLKLKFLIMWKSCYSLLYRLGWNNFKTTFFFLLFEATVLSLESIKPLNIAILSFKYTFFKTKFLTFR